MRGLWTCVHSIGWTRPGFYWNYCPPWFNVSQRSHMTEGYKVLLKYQISILLWTERKLFLFSVGNTCLPPPGIHLYPLGFNLRSSVPLLLQQSTCKDWFYGSTCYSVHGSEPSHGIRPRGPRPPLYEPFYKRPANSPVWNFRVALSCRPPWYYFVLPGSFTPWACVW